MLYGLLFLGYIAWTSKNTLDFSQSCLDDLLSPAVLADNVAQISETAHHLLKRVLEVLYNIHHLSFGGVDVETCLLGKYVELVCLLLCAVVAGGKDGSVISKVQIFKLPTNIIDLESCCVRQMGQGVIG